MQNPWNSLELIKVLVSALTPILVVIIGFVINKRIKELDSRQWTNQKILEKRLLVYDKVVPILNDILCYHSYIGCWKELSAKKIIEYKRILDKEFNVYSPLFCTELLTKYNAFIKLCYRTNTGWGNDAKIKALYYQRKNSCITWQDTDKDLFDEDYINDASVHSDKEDECIKKKKNAYAELLNTLSASLEIMQTQVNQYISGPSINFTK